MNTSLQTAFDPERFRCLAHRIVDMLADRLRSDLSGADKVRGSDAPEEEYQHWSALLKDGGGDVFTLLREFAERSIHLHNPRYVGHQVCPPAPDAAIAGFVGELLNNGMAVFEMGPAATAMERWVVEKTCALIGFNSGAGFLSSGGTLGTLTALLAARARQLGEVAVQKGTDPNWAVLVSEEAHYCTERAVHVMGWGRGGVIRVPTDSLFKMRVDLLDAAFEEALAGGRIPVAVVASACTTSTGSYDSLQSIAEFCRRRSLWFHVDGAHGGAVAFCPELRSKIDGVELADSVVLDFHKLLLTPALATAVLFRDAARSWAAFQQNAQYLWDASMHGEWFNVGRRSFECTKISLSLKIVALWHGHGMELFAENLRAVHAAAIAFYEMLEADHRFDVAVRPESNIVCFRLRCPGVGGGEADAIQQKIRTEVIGSGEFYIVQTSLRGRTWLRAALMNPFTSQNELEALLGRIAEIGGRWN